MPNDFPIPLKPCAELIAPLNRIVAERVSGAKAQETPYILFVLGIPGSGKTSFVRSLLPLLDTNPPLVIAFDEMMDHIPSFHEASDRSQAFEAFEPAARDAGYRLLHDALQKRCHIVFEHSGARTDHVELARYARDAHGYRLCFAPMTVSVEEALTRVRRRNETGARHTPEQYIPERHATLETLLPAYRELADMWWEDTKISSLSAKLNSL